MAKDPNSWHSPVLSGPFWGDPSNVGVGDDGGRDDDNDDDGKR